MSKVDQSTLAEFGVAVLRAVSLRGWTLEKLSNTMGGACGKSMLSKITKGKRDTISPRIVGKLINALDLDESWIDRFIGMPSENGEETKAETEADSLIDRLQREQATAGAGPDLLIQLANHYTEGDHRDLQTAYISVKAALEELETNRDIAAMAGNADAQFAALLREVDSQIEQGDFEQAARILDDEEDRQERVAELRFKKQLGLDRLRNRPDLTATRLIRDLQREAQPGGLFWAVDDLTYKWLDDGHKAGDMFALRVALALAKANYEDRGKRNGGLIATALTTLGWGHLRIALRSRNERHLQVAKTAFEAALKKTSKTKDAPNWAARQGGLGLVLREMGERALATQTLINAVSALRATLEVLIEKNSHNLKAAWHNLGTALQTLGEITHDPASLDEAITAFTKALALKDKETDPLDWETTQNNLALAQRHLGAVKNDVNLLTNARASYAACEALDIKAEAPFDWAMLQWNIADLALARHTLDPDPALLTEARDHIAQARAVFVEGSNYQTQRCDDLLARAEAAELESDYSLAE